jgi:hypothetical protein
MTVIACLSHWYVQLLFAVPALAILGYMGRDSLRRKQARRKQTTPIQGQQVTLRG